MKAAPIEDLKFPVERIPRIVSLGYGIIVVLAAALYERDAHTTDDRGIWPGFSAHLNFLFPPGRCISAVKESTVTQRLKEEGPRRLHFLSEISQSAQPNPKHRNKKGPPLGEPFSLCHGAGTRNRTRDLLITSQLLYQLSYTGVWAVIIGI
jgi:hypothetical protein